MTKLDDFLRDFKPLVPSIKIGRTFYFDESNNIKKGVIGFEKDNNDDLENLYFVLGGIALSEPLNFEELLQYVGARQKPVDAKFKFFSFGESDFKEALKQKRLKLFFEYLLNKSILIHFTIEHFVHLAMTDILDSLIEENDTNQFAAFHFYKDLQSDMTEVLFADYETTHDFLCEFSFPNVPKERANEFINRLLDIYTNNLDAFFDSNGPDGFTKELLRQIIKAKRNKQNLFFLEGNEPFVVYNDLHQTYLSRAIEIDDKKIFDNESSTIQYISSLDGDYEKKLNMSFVDSKGCRETQISDAICGFVAKLYNFLSHNGFSDIAKFILSLEKDSNELETMKLFSDLMTVSNDASPAMFKKVNPLYIERRFTFMIQLIEKRFNH